MLKPIGGIYNAVFIFPAAFGRLCVETANLSLLRRSADPAAFGRLCVETNINHGLYKTPIPAAFGRLCVETCCLFPIFEKRSQPPSGGCVLKRGT